MYAHKIKEYGGIIAEAQAVTGTATIGNKNLKYEVGEHLASLAVCFTANGNVTLANNAAFTATVEHSDTIDGAFTAAGNSTVTISPGFTAVSGQPLATIPLRDCKRFVQIKISGSGVTGTVDCFYEYMAR